jgi:hypothetical protein
MICGKQCERLVCEDCGEKLLASAFEKDAPVIGAKLAAAVRRDIRKIRRL